MNETAKLIGVGYLVLVATLVAEFLASLALGRAGLVPQDAVGGAWLWAVTWMMLLAAPLVLAASFGSAYALIKVNTAAEALPVGLVWAGIAGLTHAMIGLGNGTIGMFASPGTYVMLAAVALGAWLAGRHRERRAA